jgi:hypothetical protein
MLTILFYSFKKKIKKKEKRKSFSADFPGSPSKTLSLSLLTIKMKTEVLIPP